jgi:hypothetical protein
VIHGKFESPRLVEPVVEQAPLIIEIEIERESTS